MEKLKEEVKIVFDKVGDDPLAQLEQIDMLQRLGLSYHFEKEIESIIKALSNDQTCCNDSWNKKNLHAVALEFRLLRQHRYHLDPQGRHVRIILVLTKVFS